ncbi:TadE/TadG family type IV pilus assembly protein [Aeromicrobium sp. NPDC092404]|uniref:TadE/TadG family type IV pilus assembly protein n=1 Tax=Aeromicrobium sp. NPDC092404 TaxID=3154976 RepID=UPI003449AAFA
MRRLNRPRDERGVAATFFGLAIVVLIAGLGLSVDVGNVAYQRNNAQHAADSAARQLAKSCAKSPSGTECAALQPSASTIAAQSFDGGQVTASWISATGRVTVTVEKDIDTPLLGVIGVESKRVKATAVASSQSGHPVKGLVALPLGVSYCTWKNNAQFAGTPSEAAHKTSIRTDTLQSLRTMLSPIDTSALRNLLDIEGFQDYLDTKAVDKCTEEDGTQIATFKGAVWLTGETVVSNIIKGLFGWDASKCELNVDSELSTFLGGLQGAALLPQGCAQHFGNGKRIDKGKTILIPIFKPYSTLQDEYGLKLATACASLLGPSKACVEVPPKLGVEIVGFAPFVVTGWKYPGNPANVDGSVSCADIPLKYNLKSALLNTLSLVELVLNLGLNLVNGVLSQDLTASITCNGLQGYFTKSFTKDPNFEYEQGEDEFGAHYVSLVE